MEFYLDLAGQEALRRTLRLYAKAHGIGVPRLASRISADNPKRIEVPIKTLARFLAGHRVNDAALTACASFAHKVDDPLTPLGETLQRCFGTALLLEGDISGSYVVVHNNVVCPVEITAEQQFWRMTERDRNSARIYEGIVIHMAGVFVAFLKDRIFGLPRNYHLKPTLGLSGYFSDHDGAERIRLSPANE